MKLPYGEKKASAKKHKQPSMIKSAHLSQIEEVNQVLSQIVHRKPEKQSKGYVSLQINDPMRKIPKY
jgi:hypothetical protein